MATINTAVQGLINKINGGVALTPEETMYLAQAVNALSENTTLEQAIIAVAEEHLTTATNATNNATTAIQTATTSMNTAKDTLVAEVSKLNTIPEIRELAFAGQKNFVLGNNMYDLAFRRTTGSSNNSSGFNVPQFSWSLEDFVNGMMYFAYAEHTGSVWQLVFNTINLQGISTSVVKSWPAEIAQSSAPKASYCLFSNGMHFIMVSGTTIYLYNITTGALIGSVNSVEDGVFYYDAVNKVILYRSGTTVREITGTASTNVVSGVTLSAATQAAFTTWVNANKVKTTLLSGMMGYTGNSLSYIGYSARSAHYIYQEENKIAIGGLYQSHVGNGSYPQTDLMLTTDGLTSKSYTISNVTGKTITLNTGSTSYYADVESIESKCVFRGLNLNQRELNIKYISNFLGNGVYRGANNGYYNMPSIISYFYQINMLIGCLGFTKEQVTSSSSGMYITACVASYGDN